MTGEFFIDNTNIFTAFGVCVKEGGYDELLAFPALVEPDKNVWPEEDGIEVDLSAPVLSGKELAISFVIVKTCSDICFPIVQKNCPMFALKLRNFHHSHNRMGFYPSHSVL